MNQPVAEKTLTLGKKPESAPAVPANNLAAQIVAEFLASRKWEYNIRFADPNQPLDGYLNMMGNDGWELKSHTERASGMAHIPNQILLVFGRPKI